MSVIEFKNVNKYFGSGSAKVHALKDINFSADKGEFVLILGPSGSGKSTFLTIAGNILSPSSGSVLINGKEIATYSNKEREQLRLEQIGFVLQAHNLVPYLTLKEQFELVDRVKKTGNLSSADLERLLAHLEIAELKDKYPNELSGGQSQRAAIARALYTDPEIILADEPTAALDSQRVKKVGTILQVLAKQQNKAVITVTHDLRLIEQADKIYELTDGQLVQKK
ncbi:ABC transporter ATP-binding protein [Ligilactobacillus murinus]|jgi:putative ABC transport system ATP-binding protein|uniref:Putative hemin import ATP-binding protein HrtA n=2 Tax=Ligilactobacillus murinus TaxID=1622 RepID=A0A2Z4VZQ6_9LACO|nr:ABC transporter ATP-binding protein [Ligilactobacillus murinus]NBH86026.1 ABC transporter ATP-binding protein [Lachnospiraceae bacterium]HAP23797.1 ABC transporter ATP-binding protein [Lactobacillus sp.]AWZ38602.1 ABC transporter ATP-binding protein [Ligilactobacillus murinus]AWZ40403.1 ABC transporter ATP-binding protein [Ligilactobacillus murinus]KRM77059.1 ABC transporter, ATP-binding protein [Ligilactobacillus murinus DSM 20452 = NBRC 14221]